MAADSPNQPQAPTPVVNAVAPDPAKCRAEALFPGSRTARCLAEQSQTYRFFVTLDHRAMCSHPQDGRIVARTLAEKPPAPNYFLLHDPDDIARNRESLRQLEKTIQQSRSLVPEE